MWTWWTQICVRDNGGVFRLQRQIWPAGLKLWYRWAVQDHSSASSLSNLLGFMTPCFLICRVLQRSATIWLWMLCEQKPGLRLLTRTIKAIGGLPGASPSKTERENVRKKPSWCRQVLWSLWCTHGVSYSSLLVRNPPKNYIFSPASTRHSIQNNWMLSISVTFIHESYNLGLLEM